MDLFSHVLLGFVLGQGLRQSRDVQVILIVSSAILDIDAIATIAEWEAWFQFHRGPLHSFLGAALVSVAIAAAYVLLTQAPAGRYISVVLVCFAGSFSHILLDLLTPWSMPLLWPFSSQRIALDLTHFVDPIVLGVLLLASFLIVYEKSGARIVQIIAVTAIILLAINVGVRYYQRNAALETVQSLEVDLDSELLSLPTVRPDRWWVVVRTPFEEGYEYKIYNVDSIGHKILSHNTVESPFVDYSAPVEPPIDSAREAVAYSRRDARVSAFVDKSRLPAANVGLSDDGGTWQVFWYDVFTEISGGLFRGIIVSVQIDGTTKVDFLTRNLFQGVHAQTKMRIESLENPRPGLAFSHTPHLGDSHHLSFRTALGLSHSLVKEYFDISLPIHREKISCLYVRRHPHGCRASSCLYLHIPS